MSELKAYLFCDCDEMFLDNGSQLSNEMRPYYLKSEADKVIAELEDKLQNVSSILKETREWLVESQKMHKRCADNAVKVICRQKYKRCIDKAEMCKARYDEEDAKVNDGLSWTFISPEMKYWERWQWRWEALAEKFKPNNEVNNA